MRTPRGAWGRLWPRRRLPVSGLGGCARLFLALRWAFGFFVSRGTVRALSTRQVPLLRGVQTAWTPYLWIRELDRRPGLRSGCDRRRERGREHVTQLVAGEVAIREPIEAGT